MYYKVKQFRKIRLENTLHKKVPTSKKSTAFFNHFKEGGARGYDYSPFPFPHSHECTIDHIGWCRLHVYEFNNLSLK